MAIGDQMSRDAATNPVPGFAGDPPKFLYVAQSAGKSFLVADDDESDAIQSIETAVSPDGKHYGYSAATSAQGAEIGENRPA